MPVPSDSMGANPLARRHGLIWVAGLGSVGTVGAAIALQDPRIVEAMAGGGPASILIAVRWCAIGVPTSSAP